MADLKTAKQRLAALVREQEKLEREVEQADFKKKTNGVLDYIFQNEDVKESIKHLEKDEVKIIMQHLFTSEDFVKLFDESKDECNAELRTLRFKKEERKRNRALKKTDENNNEQLDFSAGTLQQNNNVEQQY